MSEAYEPWDFEKNYGPLGFKVSVPDLTPEEEICLMEELEEDGLATKEEFFNNPSSYTGM